MSIIRKQLSQRYFVLVMILSILCSSIGWSSYSHWCSCEQVWTNSIFIKQSDNCCEEDTKIKTTTLSCCQKSNIESQDYIISTSQKKTCGYTYINYEKLTLEHIQEFELSPLSLVVCQLFRIFNNLGQAYPYYNHLLAVDNEDITQSLKIPPPNNNLQLQVLQVIRC